MSILDTILHSWIRDPRVIDVGDPQAIDQQWLRA